MILAEEMGDIGLLILIFIAGFATYLTRLSFIAGVAFWQIPERLRSILRFVPASILAAMIAPAIVLVPESQAFSLDNPRLWAGLIALAVALFFRSVLGTIVSGMLALWAFQWWFSPF